MAAQETRDRILDAAEQLFAEAGFDGTSLRAITSHAGVNLAAVHYHFGSKQQLFQAAFERRMAPINAERLARLDILVSRQPDPPTVEQLLEAFLAPALRFRHTGEEELPGFLRLMARLTWDSKQEMAALVDVFREVRERFFPAFGRALPHLDPATLQWRMQFVVGTLHSVLANPERIRLGSEGLCSPDDPNETLRQMVAFVAAGLKAPLPGATDATPLSEEAHR